MSMQVDVGTPQPHSDTARPQGHDFVASDSYFADEPVPQEADGGDHEEGHEVEQSNPNRLGKGESREIDVDKPLIGAGETLQRYGYSGPIVAEVTLDPDHAAKSVFVIDLRNSPRREDGKKVIMTPQKEDGSVELVALFSTSADMVAVPKSPSEGVLFPYLKLTSDRGVVIGRDPAGNPPNFADAFGLLDRSISREHVALSTNEGGNLVVRDLDSTYGTDVKGTPVQEQQGQQDSNS